ncbi:hypothetical protein [Psychroserpens sp. MEBiC05023]
MIKLLTLHADTDELFVAYFVGLVALCIGVHLFVKYIRTISSNSEVSIINCNEDLDVKSYVLDFNTETQIIKTPSVVSKMILITLALIVAFVPFYEFVETLRPIEYVQGWTCFLS